MGYDYPCEDQNQYEIEEPEYFFNEMEYKYKYNAPEYYYDEYAAYDYSEQYSGNYYAM